MEFRSSVTILVDRHCQPTNAKHVKENTPRDWRLHIYKKVAVIPGER
ncbi:uncharacterized protein PpBr36_09850 [Pyricularia pennisetigena]|nr:uncharacterized protein PpBr36_09850 [Pyricularia pennisetigena]TLS22249.1 hypothetical protein PpBr36_09850 [Pyricularia pennisetigena]